MLRSSTNARRMPRWRLSSCLWSFLLVVSCGPKQSFEKISLESVSAPVGFKIETGRSFCRRGWLRFTVEYDVGGVSARSGAAAVLRECITQIADLRFVTAAVLSPQKAGADAAMRLSTCVATTTMSRLTIRNAEATVEIGSWTEC